MTIKELRNKISELQYMIHRLDKETMYKYYELNLEVLELTGYTKTYCRNYLQNNARKEQVQRYLDCILIALDMLNIKVGNETENKEEVKEEQTTNKNEKITYKKVLELCKKEINNVINNDNIDLDEHHICELISNDTIEKIEILVNEYSLSNSEYYKLLENYNFEYCTNKEEVKRRILMDSLDNNIRGLKGSFTSVKKEYIKGIK